MNGNRFLIGTLSALTMFAAGTAIAVEQEPSQQHEMKKAMDGNMSCEAMMGGMMKNGQMMSSLPPGNEKLNMQMHAEMMQAMGTIMQKYAGKIQVPENKR